MLEFFDLSPPGAGAHTIGFYVSVLRSVSRFAASRRACRLTVTCVVFLGGKIKGGTN